MITDFRTLSGSRDLEADLCIVGAGAAGITIAREHAGTSTKVLLLEAGGIEFEDDVQALYDGEEVGDVTPRDVLYSRLRFFGGTTNHWAGCCAPLNPIDFMKRPWVKHSGWPIGRAELDPYYARAHEVCELGPFVYDDRLWPEAIEADFDIRAPAEGDLGHRPIGWGRALGLHLGSMPDDKVRRKRSGVAAGKRANQSCARLHRRM